MELTGATWLVTELEDGSDRLAPLLDGTTLTLGYDGERVSGTAGCNRYFGPASLAERLRIGPLGSTMMFCSAPEGVMEQERRFLDLVGAADSLLLGGGRLELRAGGRTTIILEPLSPDCPAHGPCSSTTTRREWSARSLAPRSQPSLRGTDPREFRLQQVHRVVRDDRVFSPDHGAGLHPKDVP